MRLAAMPAFLSISATVAARCSDSSLLISGVPVPESLTPDSSRFWPVASYTPGKNPPSLDKQFVRDWLDSVHFNHQPPAPELPQDIVEKTAEKYRSALDVLKK